MSKNSPLKGTSSTTDRRELAPLTLDEAMEEYIPKEHQMRLKAIILGIERFQIGLNALKGKVEFKVHIIITIPALIALIALLIILSRIR